MAFFVAIFQEVWQDQLDSVLGTIRQDLAATPTPHPGRRTTRLFQRLGRPTQLVELSEWSDESAFEWLRSSPDFAESAASSGPPPRIERLEPLRRFERMELRPAITACVTITAPPGLEGIVQEYLLRQAHLGVKSLPGLVSRELYRARQTPGQFLAVRNWTSLAHLERFRTTDGADFDRYLIGIGSTVERFTGALAAELSLLHR